MAKEQEGVNPELVSIANEIADWLADLSGRLDLLRQPYKPSDEKHRKEVYRVLESTQDAAFRCGTVLGKHLAKMKADKLAELNPIVGVMSSHILSDSKKLQALFPEEANSISGWKKAHKILKEGAKNAENMVKVMATTGVADVVILPGTPLFERTGGPSKEVKDAGKKKSEKEETPAPEPAPEAPQPEGDTVTPPTEAPSFE